MAMAGQYNRELDFFPKEYSVDALQRCDGGNFKSNPRFFNFEHRRKKESVRLNASCVQEEVTCGLRPQREVKVGEISARKAMQAKQIHPQATEQGEDNHQRSQEDTLIIVASLKACAKQRDLRTGSSVHDYICKRGLLGTNICLDNALVNMYAKCGALVRAQGVFDELPVRDVFSWGALIAGYTQHGNGSHALNCFEWMQYEGFSPNPVIFTCILKACGSIRASEKGEEIHAEVVRQGLLENNIILGNALVDMYVKCGALAKAQKVFDELSVRNVVSWGALIAGYTQCGHGHQALSCFDQMQPEGISPNSVIFICVLKACGIIGAAKKGREIHVEVTRQGLLQKDTALGTALVDMYAKCAALGKAQEVFDELPVLDVVSWGALIAGYVQHGRDHEALNCFERMQHEGLPPNSIIFTCILKACGSIGASEKGEEIHAEVVRQGLLENNATVGNALVDMYARCGALGKAQEVFNELPVRDVVSWSSLMAGFTEHGHGHEALKYFEQMQHERISPDAATFIVILKACSGERAAEKGKEIHAEVVIQGVLENNTILGNVLVDMYAKCGALAEAQKVFDELPVRNVVSWSALMAGYAQLGKVETVFNAFNKMIKEGVEPDVIIFTVLLRACSHFGLVDEAQLYFVTMHTRFLMIPTLEHHICMVDIFGRTGQFDKAIGVIENLPPADSSDCLPLWSSLLGSCRKWGNASVGRLAFEHLVQLDEKDAAAYVCMSNIYAAARMREEADKVEALRVKNKAWKMPGCC